MSTATVIGYATTDNYVDTHTQGRAAKAVFAGLHASPPTYPAPPKPSLVSTKLPATPAPTNFINTSLLAVVVKWGV